jgi:hypothetical protein
MAEPLGFENLLAPQAALRIGPKTLDDSKSTPYGYNGCKISR